MGSITSYRIGDVISVLNQHAPLDTAEDWDNVGLLIGDPQLIVTGVVTSIDLTHDVLKTAKEKKFNLILTHHPCIFPKNQGLSKITAGSVVYEAIREGIAVAAYHTNFDVCALEILQSISQRLGIAAKGRLFEESKTDLMELVAHVPEPAASEAWVRGQGYGFWGEFPEPKAFSDFANDVKRMFNINGFWITNPVPSQVKRIAFVAGKGASFIEAAIKVGCDVFVTGEAGYHSALGGVRRGLTVMELGHRESERFFIEAMRKWISNLDLELVECQMPTQQIWLGGTQ